MNLIAAPTDISSKDLPLRDDMRLLGRILGDTLREQEGEETFELIENVRRAAVRFRKTQDDRDRVAAGENPGCAVSRRDAAWWCALSVTSPSFPTSPRTCTTTAAAAPTSRPGLRPRTAACCWRWSASGRSDISGEALQAFFDSALVSPVLTAHPTEVQRKSILDCQLIISQLLSERDRVDMTPDELEAKRRERCVASC